MSNFQRHAALPPFTRDREAKDGLKWSAAFDPPQVGEVIKIRINQIGLAKVTGYGTVEDWLGVMCSPIDPPEWWIKQNGPPSPTRDALAFGVEIELT